MNFQQLASLCPETGSITFVMAQITPGMFKVILTVDDKARQETPQLAYPLAISGTLAELDQGLLPAVGGFVAARDSVMEQAERAALAVKAAPMAKSKALPPRGTPSNNTPSPKIAQATPDLFSMLPTDDEDPDDATDAHQDHTPNTLEIE